MRPRHRRRACSCGNEEWDQRSFADAYRGTALGPCQARMGSGVVAIAAPRNDARTVPRLLLHRRSRDRFLAEAVDRGTVADLRPFRDPPRAPRGSVSRVAKFVLQCGVVGFPAALLAALWRAVDLDLVLVGTPASAGESAGDVRKLEDPEGDRFAPVTAPCKWGCGR